MNIILDQNKLNGLSSNNFIHFINFQDDPRIEDDMGSKENITKNISRTNYWNLEGTVWYVGLQCSPDSKSTTPPCTGPYPNYTFTFTSLDGKHVYSVKTDSNGKFRVFLEPSSYITSGQGINKDVIVIQKDILYPSINIIVNSALE